MHETPGARKMSEMEKWSVDPLGGKREEEGGRGRKRDTDMEKEERRGGGENAHTIVLDLFFKDAPGKFEFHLLFSVNFQTLHPKKDFFCPDPHTEFVVPLSASQIVPHQPLDSFYSSLPGNTKLRKAETQRKKRKDSAQGP